jgi:hypothetical protein
VIFNSRAEDFAKRMAAAPSCYKATDVAQQQQFRQQKQQQELSQQQQLLGLLHLLSPSSVFLIYIFYGIYCVKN